MTENTAVVPTLRARTGDFVDLLDAWMAALKPIALADLIEEAHGPEHVGLFCVDVIGGFCHEGALYSERVEAIVAPIARLFTAAYEMGVSRFVMTHDAHDPDAVEFADYPPHCIRGTQESAIVPELMALPAASRYEILPKNCIDSGIGTGLDAWLDAHPEVTHRIVVGDCTDLCTYHLAMHLKLRANAFNQRHPVILPVDCVDTYDLPVEAARGAGIPAHPADLFHPVFLYSMATNGIRVVSRID